MAPPTPARLVRFSASFGILSFLLGFALILGGPQRASASSYAVLAAQGGPYVWGTTFVAIGVALLVSVNRSVLMQWLLLAGVIAYSILCLEFFWTSLLYSDANLTAVVAYGWIAAMHALAFVKTRAYRQTGMDATETVPVRPSKDRRRVEVLRALVADATQHRTALRADDPRTDEMAQRVTLERIAGVLSDHWRG